MVVILVAFGSEAERGGDIGDARRVEIRSGRAGADDVVALRGEGFGVIGLLVGLESAKTTQLGFVPVVFAETVMRPATPSALAAVSTLSLSPRRS